MCIFSTQTLSTLKATLKSRQSGLTIFKVILVQLLKRSFFEVLTSLFGLTPLPPLSHFATILIDPPPPPRPVTYFL